jgi:cell division transport system permease protein
LQIGILLISLVVLGSILGFISSYRAIKKYLGMSLDELY